MARYFGRFVESVRNGAAPGDWEIFNNAEIPARMLKKRAFEHASRFWSASEGLRGRATWRAYSDADDSAIMLIWCAREQPAEDKAPDEVWQLTTRGGLLRTPWSAIVEPIEDDVELHEASLERHEPDEFGVFDIQETQPQMLWRPPNLDELAERKVILVGDKRPTSSGAFVERHVERFAPRGLRQPCDKCNVVPNAFTLECRCDRTTK